MEYEYQAALLTIGQVTKQILEVARRNHWWFSDFPSERPCKPTGCRSFVAFIVWLYPLGGAVMFRLFCRWYDLLNTYVGEARSAKKLTANYSERIKVGGGGASGT